MDSNREDNAGDVGGHYRSSIGDDGHFSLGFGFASSGGGGDNSSSGFSNIDQAQRLMSAGHSGQRSNSLLGGSGTYDEDLNHQRRRRMAFFEAPLNQAMHNSPSSPTSLFSGPIGGDGGIDASLGGSPELVHYSRGSFFQDDDSPYPISPAIVDFSNNGGSGISFDPFFDQSFQKGSHFDNPNGRSAVTIQNNHHYQPVSLQQYPQHQQQQNQQHHYQQQNQNQQQQQQQQHHQEQQQWGMTSMGHFQTSAQKNPRQALYESSSRYPFSNPNFPPPPPLYSEPPKTYSSSPVPYNSPPYDTPQNDFRLETPETQGTFGSVAANILTPSPARVADARSRLEHKGETTSSSSSSPVPEPRKKKVRTPNADDDRKPPAKVPGAALSVRKKTARERLAEEKRGEAKREKDSGSAKNVRFRSYQSLNWWERYHELCDYREARGNCFVPHNWKENPSLAKWVKRQRYQYKLKQDGKHSTLTEARQHALEQIGFIWDYHRVAWEERLGDLREYRGSHGHCNVPSTYSENTQLSVWVQCQRRQYKLYQKGERSYMTEERIQKLEDMGFVWNPRPLASSSTEPTLSENEHDIGSEG